MEDRFWTWRDRRICYWAAQAADDAPAMVLIHGFGAGRWHWRKNIPELSAVGRIYAIDLLGFGGSDKPRPTPELPYTFETWGQQVADFLAEVVGSPAILVGNSVGAIAAMQAAVMVPEWVPQVVLLNCSLRLLHERKQAGLPWYRRFGSQWVQQILGNRAIAQIFFDQVRQRRSVRNILQQAYARRAAITDELIDFLLEPAQDPGAVDVFMAFVRYSQGPTPEDLLAALPCPATILWGAADPWEPIALARAWQHYPAVTRFVPFEGVGHCPQDEAPELVNPYLKAALADCDARHAIT
jgi:pimeloyl-ACP methyl ester carboxylesterase